MKTSSIQRAMTMVAACAVALVLSSPAWAGDIKGKVTAQGLRSPANIAVYIDSIPGKSFTPPAQHASMDQVHLAFAPHVLVVLKGTTVDFTNEDPVGHNVYWPAINRNRKLAHNMGTWPQGQKKSFTFNDLGEVPLLCNVHPEMSGYIVVAPTPYFAVTDKQGNFVIKDVPAGTYTLKTWSEEAKPSTQPVKAGAGVTAVNLTVKR
jgi:plastocyanin